LNIGDVRHNTIKTLKPRELQKMHVMAALFNTFRVKLTYSVKNWECRYLLGLGVYKVVRTVFWELE